MSRLRPVKARDVRRVLEKLGYSRHQGRGKGAHVVMVHPERDRFTTLSWHGGAQEIPRGTLKQILDDIGLSWAEFEKLL